MSVRISVDHRKISESPIVSDGKVKFAFNSTSGLLVDDLNNGTPTTYLISGYRGSGKTSFIKNLEFEIQSKSKKTLFVYLNFAKFESRSILLRKLIRGFYQHLAQKKSNEELFKSVKADESLKDTLKVFEDLYDRTFYDVSRNTNKKNTKKVESVLGFSVTLKDILLLLIPIFLFGTTVNRWEIEMLSNSTNGWIRLVILLGSTVWTAVQFVSISKKRTVSDEDSEESSRKSFYDDEIAEFHLIQILTGFKDKVNIVFVLDELDKIDDNKVLKNLLNELKPTMLSGLASFIVVAGQNLYYDVYDSHSQDDHVLSSLFSRSHHISLSSPVELKDVIRSYVTVDTTKLPIDDQEAFEGFLDLVVFESKLVLRRLVSIVRQSLVWENGQAFIEINSSIEDLKAYSRIMDVTDSIRSNNINSLGYPGALRDFLNMQLLLKAHLILRQDVFESKIVIDVPDKSENSLYQSLKPLILNHAELLVDKLVSSGLIAPEGKDQDGTYKTNFKNPSTTTTATLPLVDTSALLIDFRDFQRIASEVYRQLKNITSDEITRLGFSQIAVFFVKEKLFELPGLNSSTLQTLFNNPRVILEDHETQTDAIELFRKHKLDFPSYINKVLVYYTQVSFILEFSGYVVEEQGKNTGLDILVKARVPDDPDIILNIKFRRKALTVLKEDIYQTAELLNRYQASTGKISQAVLVLYSDEGTSGLEKVDFRFKQIIEDSLINGADRISLISAYIGNLHFLPNLVKKFKTEFIGGYTTYPDAILESQAPPKSRPDIDDHYLPKTFDVISNDYTIKVLPQMLGSHWRFGIKFSGSSEFPEVTKRHAPFYPVLHLERNPQSQDVRISYYNNQGKQEFSKETELRNFSNHPFYILVSFDKNKTTIKVLNEDRNPITDDVSITNVYMFRIFAWADGQAKFRWVVSVEEKKLRNKRSLVRAMYKQKENSFSVKVVSSQRYPVSDVQVFMVAANGTLSASKTDSEGIATFDLINSRLYTLLVAGPGFFGSVLRDVDINRDITIDVITANDGAGSVLFADGTGNIPVLDGRLNPILDDQKRFYLYTNNISVNNETQTPVKFEIDQPILLEDKDQRKVTIYVRFMIARIALIDYMHV